MAEEIVCEVIGPMPPSHLEQDAEYHEKVGAAMRQAVTQVQFAWRRKASPSRLSGEYEQGIEALELDEGSGPVGFVTATAEHSQVLEEGRLRSMSARDYGLKAFPVGANPFGGPINFAKHVSGFQGKHYGQRTYEETLPKVQERLNAAAGAIAESITARRGGGL
jgi:hypothetical protein